MNGKENPCLNTKAPSISSLGDEDETAAIRRMTTTHGSTADIAARLGSARFTPQSRQSADMLACPLRANSRHMHRSKKSTAIRSLRRRQRAGNAQADLRCLRCGWQFIEQGLRVGQVRRTAPCVEEPIDVQQAVVRLRMPTLIGQNPGEARCRAQFERSSSLAAGDGDRPLVTGDRRGARSAAGKEITEQAMDFRFNPSLAGFARNPKRFLERAMGEVRLVVRGIGIGEERQANRAKYP